MIGDSIWRSGKLLAEGADAGKILGNPLISTGP